MATTAGPNIISEQNLVVAFDSDLFPQGWNVTQLVPNSEFIEGGTKPYDHGCYTSGYYLGPDTASIMTGNTLRFTGGDLSNYYVTNPEYRGWDAGGLGNTGGNWMHYVVLPTALSSTEDFIVETRARFVYVSRTGNGSADPRFQIGRHYYEQYGINYSQLGTAFKKLRFAFNGASVPESANAYLTFGCTSPDAMLELDYFRAYSINKDVGLKNLADNSSINIFNASINTSAELVFDGTNDYLSIAHNANQSFIGDFTIEAVIYPTGNTANCIIQKGSGNDYYQEYWLLQDMRGSNRYISLIMGRQGNASANYINTGNISVLNTYHHIIATVSSATAKIYVNGVEQASGSITNRIQSTADIRIGWRVDGFAATAGKIPLVRVYNQTFSALQVQKHYVALKSRFNI